MLARRFERSSDKRTPAPLNFYAYRTDLQAEAASYIAVALAFLSGAVVSGTSPGTLLAASMLGVFVVGPVAALFEVGDTLNRLSYVKRTSTGAVREPRVAT